MKVINKNPVKAFRSKSQLKLPRGPFPQRKQQISSCYKLTFSNIGVIDSVKHHRASSDSMWTHALHPQLHKKTIENVYRVNKSRSLKQILEAKLKTQQQRMAELKMKQEARQKEIATMRKLQTREKERKTREALRQSKRKRQEEGSWRQKTQQRQRSESSFIRETRNDSIGMLRRSRLIQSRSEKSLIDQKFRETVRSSKFDQQHRSLQLKKQQYQHQYRKAFLKNTAPPKQEMPEALMYSTLREKAEKITQTYTLPQHLPKLAKRSASQLSNKDKKGANRLQQELMISSMRPAQPKQKKPKIINPQSPTPSLSTKTPPPSHPLPNIEAPLQEPSPSMEPLPSNIPIPQQQQ